MFVIKKPVSPLFKARLDRVFGTNLTDDQEVDKACIKEILEKGQSPNLKRLWKGSVALKSIEMAMTFSFPVTSRSFEDVITDQRALESSRNLTNEKRDIELH